MKKLVIILFSTYFLLGILIFQQSDFSTLQDLSAMYHHCQQTEDKDLTPLDFITDHLLNLDCIFDQHDNGDPQKPHMPLQFDHQNFQNIFVVKEIEQFSSKPRFITQLIWVNIDDSYPGKFIADIFRPPLL